MKNLRTMMLSPVLGLAVSMVPALAIAKDAAVVAVAPAPASSAPYGVGMRSVTWIDTSRGIKKSMGFEGSDTRRIDVTIWYPTSAKRGAPENDAPAAGDGPWPLVIYAHGTMGYPSNNMNTVNELVSNGYVVVAPTFPLSSRAAFTHIKFADVSDLRQQVGDVSFLIDKTLADPMLSKIVNPQEIGFIGHSLGGVTGYFATYGGGINEPRLKAVVLAGSGDPVQTALTHDMGVLGTPHLEVSVPVLFLTAEKDVFTRMTGRPYAAFARVEGPKYQIMIKNGVHSWLRDADNVPPGNKSPDCAFFENWFPNAKVPGCEAETPLIDPKRENLLARTAAHYFFDAYLKDNDLAERSLQNMGENNADVSVIFRN